MNIERLKKLLEAVQGGKTSVKEALEGLKSLPFEDLEFATIDTHRSLRQGFPEVIFGQGKTTAQIRDIAKSMLARGENVLVTRLDEKKGKALLQAFPGADHSAIARTFFIKSHPVKITGKGTVLVICAGTSDIPVAEEAAVTAECMGNRVERLYDIGVSGLHRLLHRKKELSA